MNQRSLAAAAIVFAAACGHKTATRTPGNSGGGAPAGGPPYLAVFEDGKQLRYKRVTESSMYDPEDPKADANGQVKEHSEHEVACKIAAKTLGAYQVAALTCTEPAGEEVDNLLGKLAAVYVADARGVWRIEGEVELPADEAAAAALATGAPLLAAKPEPVEDRHEDPEEGSGTLHKVSQDPKGAWCVDDDGWGGDEGGDGICFAAGKGITKVSTYFAGGSVRDDWFELIE